MLPVRDVGGGGVQLAIIEETKAALLPDECAVQPVCNDLDILGLDGLFDSEQVDEL
jgi:hypothetical protein